MAQSQKALLRSLLKRLLLVLGMWFVLHSVFVTVDGMSQPQRTADVAVVLGTTVHPDGKASPWLQARLARALELYRQNQVQNIMVSGGTGIEGHDEAQVMRDYLLQHGVPERVIWVDSHGDNTGLSAEHAAALMQKQDWYNAIVVSQFFHVSRAKMQFKKAGIAEVETASPKLFSVFEFVPLWREWPAYYVHWLGLKAH
ncbi:YdcF family protein [Vitreoscilla massiliensis]|uniref:YdcF family protein n=1 Tax=Vitreoscilla massiliensis TaxID=1689272 RepID=A0ABY4E5E2_9NEIS|nr:YdcF family protein [Vitreoscilla massiliensis]UOO88647.1 YdcF family protein [Vitreoscilla massiliensis]